MAGWSKTNYKNERFTAEIAAEFVEAINERSALFGMSEFSAPTDKSKISAEFWSGLQQRVIDLFPCFYPPQNYHKVDNAPAKYTSLQFWTAVYKSASYPVENFVTAVDSLPANYQDPKSAGFITRKVQAGDILGGWLLDNLQRAINLLVRPGITLATHASGVRRLGGSYYNDSWGAAVSAALANVNTYAGGGSCPEAWFNVYKSGSWGADLRAQDCVWDASGITISPGKMLTVDIFGRMVKISSGDHFFAFGKDYAEDNICKIAGADITANNKLIAYQPVDFASASEVINPGQTTARRVGYGSNTIVAIGKLDKPGGFKYY